MPMRSLAKGEVMFLQEYKGKRLHSRRSKVKAALFSLRDNTQEPDRDLQRGSSFLQQDLYI